MRSLTFFTSLLGPAAAANYGHIRADEWLADFSEQGTKNPTDGRRVHVVADLTQGVADEDLKSVVVNGQDCLMASIGLGIDNFDWCRAHTNKDSSQIWISYHTRNVAMHENLQISVTSTSGETLAEGPVAAQQAGSVALSYVATRRGGHEVVMHLHADKTGGSITRVLLDGSEVDVPEAVRQLPASGHAVLTVTGLGFNKPKGNVWSVVLFTDTNPEGLAYGGRWIGERFPIMAWPHSEDCPVPGVNDINANALKNLHIDTVYFTASDSINKCGADFEAVMENLAKSGDDFMVMPPAREFQFTRPEGLPAYAAVFVGDEVDGEIDEDHLTQKLADSLHSIRYAREVPTYQGSKTNHNVGAFCGITDIQGSDAYNAACAPTMVPVVEGVTPNYPYHYLRNARNNHAPLPFWGYSQLYSDAWSYQANANELGSQIVQMILSGSKAVMLFQSFQKFFESQDTSNWVSILNSINTLKEEIRVGDIEGMKVSTSDAKNVMTGTILTPEKLVVIVLNIKASGYSNTGCHVLVGKHWSFSSTTLKSLNLDLSSSPGVQGLSNWMEVVDGASQPAAIAVSGSTLSNIELSSKVVARFFVADVATSTSSFVTV